MKAAGFVHLVLISAAMSALALGVYDHTVRQPRTPRIAVVDIARLYAAAESQARSRLVAGTTAAAVGTQPGSAANRPADAATPAAAPPSEFATMREMGNFGPRLEGVLRQLSTECRCVIAAMAAVVGEVVSVPDYTLVTAGRLGVALPSTAASPTLPRQ